jgi:SM-20-related protein
MMRRKSTLSEPHSVFDAALIGAALRSDGFWIDTHAVEIDLCDALRADLQSLDAVAALSPAALGRAGAKRYDANVRDDRIAWLTPTTPAQRSVLAALDALRCGFNASLYLGLASVEAHFAKYAPGARYQRHLDRFPGARNRVVSVVLYLNPHWDETDHGELILYTPTPVSILPRAGTAAMFLSEEFPHEVAAPRRERLSIAAWLRST